MGLVSYTAYIAFTRESRPSYEVLVIYFGLLMVQYLIRQGLMKQNLVRKLDEIIKSFESLAGHFRSTCHQFDLNPPPLFLKYVDDAHDLIVGSWLDLLKESSKAAGTRQATLELLGGQQSSYAYLVSIARKWSKLSLSGPTPPNWSLEEPKESLQSSR